MRDFKEWIIAIWDSLKIGFKTTLVYRGKHPATLNGYGEHPSEGTNRLPNKQTNERWEYPLRAINYINVLDSLRVIELCYRRYLKNTKG